MSRSTSKKTGKSNGSQKKTINSPVNKQQKVDANQVSAKPENEPAQKPLNNKTPLVKEPSANKAPSANKKPADNYKKPQHSGTNTVQTTTKKQGSALSLFAILLSLVALGFSGYQWYSSKINSTEANTQFALDIGGIGNQVTRISDSVARLKKDQANIVTQAELENKIIKANSSFDKQILELEQGQNTLTDSVTTINEELKKGANQYVLDEVSQLLRLANNSAIFTGDAESAVNAFKLADIQLKELNNPRYAVVRRKINEEIQLLKSINQVDSQNILAQLNFINNNVSSLPLENKLPANKATLSPNSQAQNDEKFTVSSEFRKMWSDVINSVSIQKVDQPPKALLAPRERYLLDQNLKLQLVKAEIALLQNNQTLYKNSITEASKWVNDYFDPENKLVQKILAQLATLKNEKLNTQLPGVSGSYDLLQTIKGGQ